MEHMPREGHCALFDALTGSVKPGKFILISIAHLGQVGHGHISNRDMEDWKHEMRKRGFVYRQDMSRDAVYPLFLFTHGVFQAPMDYAPPPPDPLRCHREYLGMQSSSLYPYVTRLLDSEPDETYNVFSTLHHTWLPLPTRVYSRAGIKEHHFCERKGT
eukprot:PhF_6_TR30146/c0_g1_i2/m.44125